MTRRCRTCGGPVHPRTFRQAAPVEVEQTPSMLRILGMAIFAFVLLVGLGWFGPAYAALLP